MNNIYEKNDMTTQELQMLATEMDNKRKSSGAAWLLWLFLGGLGGHRYYMGKYGTAILMTLTLGCIGIWTIIDAFLLNGMLKRTNRKIETDIIRDIKSLRH